MGTTSDGPLSFDAYLKTADFKKGIEEMERRIIGVTQTANREAEKMDSIYRKLGGAIGGIFAANQLQGFVTEIVKVRGEFQQLEIALTTILKSKVAADSLMGQIVDFAGKTPFELSEVAQGSKLLLAYGFSAKNVVNELRMIGDVAAGVSKPLLDVAEMYGKIRTQGVAMSEEINEIAGRGIPIYEELVKVLNANGKAVNVTTDQIKKLASESRISFSDIQQAFINMTSGGGMFEGLTEKQSKSLNGLVSNFKDAVERMINDLGKGQEGLLASTITTATTLVDNYEEVLNIIKVLVFAYGGYKTAVILAAAAQKLSAASLFIEEYYAMAKALGVATANHIAFNNAAKANIYLIGATALAALIGYLVTYSDELSIAEKAQKRLADKQVIANVNKEKTEITGLVKVLQSQNLAESVRLEAYNKINAVTPSILKGLDFTKAKTADLTAEVNNYIAALEKKLRLELGNEKLKVVLDKQADAQQAYNDAFEKLTELEQNRKKAGFSNDLRGVDIVDYTKGDRLLLEYRENVKNTFKALRATQDDVEKASTSVLRTAGLTAKEILEVQINEIKGVIAITNKFDPERKKLEEQLGTLEDRLSKLTPKKGQASFTEQLAEANDFGRLRLLKSLQKTDDEYKAYTEKILSVRSPFKQGTKDYDQLTQLLNQVKKQNKDLTDGEQPAPLGTLEYWKKVSKDYLDALGKLDPLKDSDKIELYKKKRFEAELKVAELSAKYETKSFEDTLETKKKLYESFEAYRLLKGQEAAEKDYQGLLKEAKSYQDFINKQTAVVEAKINQGTATDQDRANLLKLRSEDVRIFEEGLEDKKKRYELFNKWVLTYGKEAADKEFQDLIAQGADYKVYLQNQIAAIEARIKAAPAIEEQNKLITIKNAFEIETEGLEKYKKRIEETADLMGSLTEQIAFFNQEQAKISPFDTSRTLFLATLRLQAEKERKKLLNDYLVETNSFELKRSGIEKYYNDLRIQLDKGYSDGRIRNNKQALDKINADEQQALIDLREFEAQEILKRSKAYNEMQKILFLPDDATLKIRIEQLKSALSELESTNMVGTETYKKQLMELVGLQDQLVDSNIQYFNRIGDIFSSINTEAGGLFGGIGKIGKYFSEISGYVKKYSELTKTIKKTDAAIKTAKTPEEAIAAGALGAKEVSIQKYTLAVEVLVDVFNKLSQKIEENKKRQKEFYNSAINQQNEYNKLVNEELLAKSDNSFYTPDAFTKINNAVAAGKEILTKYNTAFETLVAKGKTIVKPAGIFIWSKDKTKPIFDEYPKLIDESSEHLNNFNLELAKTLIATGNLDDATKGYLQSVIDYIEQYEKTQEQIKETIKDLTGQIGQDLKNAIVDAFKAGESAAMAFSNTIGNVLENIITEQAYLEILKPQIDKLVTDFEESYARDNNGNPIGDRDIKDDLKRNLEPIKTASEELAKAIQDGKEYVQKEFGLDIFKNDSKNSLSGSIKSLTEETGGVLAGQLNAIRITQAQQHELMRSQLLTLNRIAVNSDFLQRLETMDKNIAKMANNGDLRAGGL